MAEEALYFEGSLVAKRNTMNKTLRIALCGLENDKKEEDTKEVVDDENRTIQISGPLSEIYTNALRVVYARKDPVTEQTSMESQANDALIAMSVARAAISGYSTNVTNKDVQSDLSDNIDGANTAGYAINISKVNNQVVIDASQKLSPAIKQGRRAFLIVDMDGFILPLNKTDGHKVVYPEFDHSMTVYNPSFTKSLVDNTFGMGLEMVFGFEGLLKALKQKS